MDSRNVPGADHLEIRRLFSALSIEVEFGAATGRSDYPSPFSRQRNLEREADTPHGPQGRFELHFREAPECGKEQLGK